MFIVLIVSLGLSGAVNHGLNDTEVAQFKPINATRVEQNTGLTGKVNISDNGGSYWTVYSNGVPSHGDMVWPEPEGRPIYLQENPTAINIPKVPKLRDTPLMCVPFGIVGVATGGTVIYNAYSPRKNCPMALQVEVFDQCGGHPNPSRGHYHYHGHSSCNRMEVCGEQSKIFGVAIDGIPMFGPFDENGKQLIQTDLDICGGRTGADGRYRYHMTGDPPFYLNCLRGEIHKDLHKTSNPTRDAFMCNPNCPMDDNFLPTCVQDKWCEDPEKFAKYSEAERNASEAAFKELRYWKKANRDFTCNWNVTSGDFAECIEKSNSSYTKGFAQVRKNSSHTLVGCCPKGEECGETCEKNSKCYFETRVGMFLETEILAKKDKSGSGALTIGALIYIIAIAIAC